MLRALISPLFTLPGPVPDTVADYWLSLHKESKTEVDGYIDR